MPLDNSRRLSAQDAAFLYFERDTLPLHIGSVAVFDGEIPYETFVANLDAKLHTIPRYRQRVVFPPLNLAHPTWEDDPDFDIRRHIVPYELRAPGDDAALAQLASDLFAPALSRDKPLWELYIVRGLRGGRGAIISKVHHCLVDGVAGIQLLLATLELTPDPQPPPPAPPFEPKPLPSPLTLLNEAMWESAIANWQRWTALQLNLLNPRPAFDRARTFGRALEKASPYLVRPAPQTVFSGRPTSRRACAWSEFSFGELRAIRQTLGGTVNDVVLAILSGAIGRYLEERGDPVPDDFRAMIPVNVRREGEEAAGNRVSIMIARLPLSERDPIARLRAIRDQVTNLKEANQAGGIDLLLDMVGDIPVPIQALAGNLDVRNTLFNVTCTNVPGPMIPLYSVGQRLQAHYPLVPLAPDLSLAVGVTSYNHMLYFNLMADPDNVPDVDRLKLCLDEAFLELREAAGVPVSEVLEVGSNGESRVKTASAVS